LPIQGAFQFVEECKSQTFTHFGSFSNNICEITIFLKQMRKIVLKHCPDVMCYSAIQRQKQYGNVYQQSNFSISRSNFCANVFVEAPTSEVIIKAIYSSLHDPKSNDPLGLRAELLFSRCLRHYHQAAIDTAASCALLSSNKSPPPCHSYSALAKDPLVLLKCHVSIWDRLGLRRMLLSIIQRLFKANANILREAAPTKKLAHEMLLCRDLILVRSLVLYMSGDVASLSQYGMKNKYGAISNNKLPNNATFCAVTCGIIRSMVAQRRGLVAMMIKQGLSNNAVDWIVEFVPECLSDARYLCTCLSDERNFLTASERLAVADASLRIATAHGYRNESLAQPLLYSSLSVLISSFFLVLGPVGVAVNVLCEKETGEDITQKCRKSTLRMLNALQNISSSKSDVLKNEVAIGLGKLITHCKSEGVMGGVTGVAAKRRKVVVKEIWDATIRVMNTLGAQI